ncbi:response regulator transcription factor [Sulfurimonas sp.]
MKKSILLLEDDYELAETLKELLELDDYQVTLVHNGNDAIDASYEKSYGIYIFDINVPDMSGIELLKSLRYADDKTPTIFISALVDLNSISEAFEVGGDDYLKKPFFPQELLIRVNAKFAQSKKSIEYKNLKYFPDTKELYNNDKIVSLGEVQECLCDVFMHNIGRVVDKTILMDCLTKPSDATLRVALNKFKHSTDLEIKNIRGVGYILEKS